MQTEVHVYALAVAASLLLSFYPFLNVMLSFCRDVLRWPAAVDAIYLAMNDYLPGDLGAFLKRNLPLRGTFQPVAMLLLLVTANGDLRTAGGRAQPRLGSHHQPLVPPQPTGQPRHDLPLRRPGPAVADPDCHERPWVRDLSATHGQLELWVNLLIFKAAAIPIGIVILFLIYWILPNRRIPAGARGPCGDSGGPGRSKA